ncbi:hypothetical protein GN956_G26944 [Arapaima gigas]
MKSKSRRNEDSQAASPNHFLGNATHHLEHHVLSTCPKASAITGVLHTAHPPPPLGLGLYSISTRRWL